MYLQIHIKDYFTIKIARMKRFLLLCVLLFLFGMTQAQIVNIPDANFKNRLLEANPMTNTASDANGNFITIDINGNDEIEVSEAQNVFELRLSFDNISDLTGIGAFTNLEFLQSTHNTFTSLDLSQNINLTTLLCNNNDLTSLDISQNINLTKLYCYNNDFDNIDITQNINLRELRCSGNNLTTLDLSQNINLEELECHSNQLTNLDLSQNLNLEVLNCGSNSLTSLDVSQNQQLILISCIDSQLVELVLGQHPNLDTISFQNNQITSIDFSLAPNLRVLRGHTNNLSEINLTQNINLEYLWISYNQINSLDLSNNSELISLFSEYNLLTELDLSATKVDEWNVSNNQITYINIKNGLDSGAGSFFNNPIEFVCTDPDEIELYEILSSYQIPVSDYCSFVPGGDYNSIAGQLIFDDGNDGCDTNDALFPGMRIDISNGTDSGMTFSNDVGEFVFYAGTGSYTITPNFENPSWFNVSPSNVMVPFSDLNNTVTQDFCITSNGTHNDVEIVIASIIPAQPGFDANYQIVYKNKGNQVLSGVIDFNYDDNVLDLVSTSVTPINQSTGSLSWSYTDLNPFETRVIDVVLNVNSPMEIPAVNIDDVLSFEASINPISGDETSSDNTFELNEVVVGSFDPNDITCLEGDVVSPERIGDYLHYNIRFENTGTAPATFVVVKDIIDETKYDLSSIQLLYSSHNMDTQIEGNELEFFFDNINLGPNEQGNVLFKIKTLESLVIGDSVEQMANIYFDFNFPIETNTANTTFQNLSVDDQENDASIDMYPNPVSDVLTISAKTKIKSVEIYDVQGRIIQTSIVNNTNVSLHIAHLTNGVYFFKIKTEKGIDVKKVIKD